MTEWPEVIVSLKKKTTHNYFARDRCAVEAVPIVQEAKTLIEVCGSTDRVVYLLTLPLFLVGHHVGYYGPPFFPVGSNICASVYVHSCISGDASPPSASVPFTMPSVIIRCRLSCLPTCP